MQSDGKVVVVGETQDESNGSLLTQQFTVVRFNVDGTPDTSFGARSYGGGNGYFFTVPFQAASDLVATAVAIQPDGKIVVGGLANDQGSIIQIVARYLPDGTLDTSFGQPRNDIPGGVPAGVVVGGPNAGVSSIVIENSGDILLAGPGDGNFAVEQLTPNGMVDGSYSGKHGSLDLGGDDEVHAMTIDYTGSVQSNPNYGKAILVGALDGEIGVIRLNADGSLDDSFSGDGKLVMPFSSDANFAVANGVAVEANGKIVIAGEVHSSSTGNYSFGILRLNTNGTLDNSFGGSNGTTSVTFPTFGLSNTEEYAECVTIGQTGDLLVGGGVGHSEGVLAGLTSDGILDPAFAGGGMVRADVASVIISNVVLGPNGTFYTTGGEGYVTQRFFDRGMATVHIFSNDPVGAEAGQDTASFQIFRDEALPVATRVFYTLGGTATPPGTLLNSGDYTGISTIATLQYVDIPADQNFSAPIVITPRDDSVAEDDETVIITLKENPGVYDVVVPKAQTLTILDNDRQLSGTVFNDADADGSFGNNEAGLSGWTVFDDVNGNGRLDSGEPNTVTNGKGQYFMGSLGVGIKNIRAVLQTGFHQTSPVAADNILLSINSDVKDVNFGENDNATISGTVFNDLNGNGIKDSSEPLLTGWTVFVDLDQDRVLESYDLSTVTNNGAYSFNSIAPGIGYLVELVMQSDWVSTAPSANNDLDYFNLTVSPGQTSANHAFGVRQRSISGNVFNDLDRDGVKDPNESGLANLDVWIDTNGNGQFDPFPVQQDLGGITIQLPADTYAVTDANGNYNIVGGLAASTYAVQVNLPIGDTQTLPLNNAPRTVSLVSNPVSTGNNFGISQGQVKLVTTSITGSVFSDLNGNGVRDLENPTESDNVGWLVWLDTDNDGSLDNGEVSQTTDGGGNFNFDNLQPDVTYHLRSQLQSGWIATTPGEFDVTLNQDQSIDEHFGVQQEAMISGNVFNDADGNGAKTSGEAGIAGVKVYLDQDKDGSPGLTEPFTMTDPSGNYSFTLPAGTYRIREVVPGGRRLDSPASGFFDVRVDPGQIIPGENFANAPTSDPSTVTLQGETATLAGGTAARHDNGGYTGTGYADFGDTKFQRPVDRHALRRRNGFTGLALRQRRNYQSAAVDCRQRRDDRLRCLRTDRLMDHLVHRVHQHQPESRQRHHQSHRHHQRGGANIDSLTINTAPAAAIYQGESATLAGGTLAKHDNSGFTGTGYTDFGSTNSSATFTVAGNGSNETLTFRYANGSTANRPLSVSVNGTVVGSVTFGPTGSWTTWSTITLNVNLLTGSNLIKLIVTGTDGPNLDWLSVS